MKKILFVGAALAALIGTPALAADMALKAAPPPAPVWSWTGFYVGINGGYSVGTDPFNETLVVPVPLSSSVDSRVTPKGGLFGGQAGYNYQTGNVVLGVEGDIQWADQHDTAGCALACVVSPPVVQNLGVVEQKIKWFGTARGRLGWANDGWLIYITGGGAWGGIDATTTFNIAGVPGGPNGAFSNATHFTKGGGVFGGGIEVRLAGAWTAKFEYLYMNLGSISDTLFIPAPIGPATLTTNSKIRDNIIRAGLNFKFY
jgi:outer membrane immunogenic protein